MREQVELATFRQEIDAIDAALVPLIEARLALSARIGRYKKAQGLPIHQADREREVLVKRAALLKDTRWEKYLRPILQNMMDVGKAVQQDEA